MLSRRGILLGGAALVALTGCSEKVTKAFSFAQRMVEIQKRHGGRVGVAALTGSGDKAGSLNIQSTERYAMCSVFKWVLAAGVLQQVDQGRVRLADLVKYGKKDLLDYAPVTTQHVSEGAMTVGDLCSAAVALSDNTAANLLYPLVGGPAGLTAFVRGLGDEVTRFDRLEPELNTVNDGDERDTSTPDAMTRLLQKVFTGNVLQPKSLGLLKDWMVATTTGKDRIPAGVPAGSVVGHKTGTAFTHCNDVGVIWPAGDKPPVFLTVFTTGGTLDDAGRDKVIADVTRLVFEALDFFGELGDETASSS